MWFSCLTYGDFGLKFGFETNCRGEVAVDCKRLLDGGEGLTILFADDDDP